VAADRELTQYYIDPRGQCNMQSEFTRPRTAAYGGNTVAATAAFGGILLQLVVAAGAAVLRRESPPRIQSPRAIELVAAIRYYCPAYGGTVITRRPPPSGAALCGKAGSAVLPQSGGPAVAA
jgi:hypothetical protein